MTRGTVATALADSLAAYSRMRPDERAAVDRLLAVRPMASDFERRLYMHDAIETVRAQMRCRGCCAGMTREERLAAL